MADLDSETTRTETGGEPAEAVTPSADTKTADKKRLRKQARKQRRQRFFADFKTFISRGNILDLAIAVVIGTAFSAIVNSLVSEIITPLLSALIGQGGVESLRVVLRPEVVEAGVVVREAIVLNIGIFLQSILNFFVIAFFIFLSFRLLRRAGSHLERVVNEGKKKWVSARYFGRRKRTGDDAGNSEAAAAPQATAAAAPEAPATAPAETAATELLTEIRDLLRLSLAQTAPEAQQQEPD